MDNHVINFYSHHPSKIRNFGKFVKLRNIEMTRQNLAKRCILLVLVEDHIFEIQCRNSEIKRQHFHVECRNFDSKPSGIDGKTSCFKRT